MGQIITAEGVDIQSPEVTDYPGTGPATDAIFFGRNPATGKDHRVPGSRMPGAGGPTAPGDGDDALNAALPVSLAAGQLGGIKTGDVFPVGTAVEAVLRKLLIQSIFPTYNPASLSLNQSAPTDGEVGETVNNTLTANFNQADAGALTSTQINKDGTRVSTAGTASPFTRNSNVVRTLSPIVYQALVSYGAGPVKNVAPAGTPDTRPPAVRNPNAPQAAESNLGSNQVQLNGYYRNFYGPANAAPTNSVQVRALAGSPLTNGPKQFVLNTGDTQRTFCIELAPGQTLVSVIDQDALNKDITAEYVAGSAIQVADASGTVTAAYTPRVKVQAAPYDNNHRHLITLG